MGIICILIWMLETHCLAVSLQCTHININKKGGCNFNWKIGIIYVKKIWKFHSIYHHWTINEQKYFLSHLPQKLRTLNHRSSMLAVSTRIAVPVNGHVNCPLLHLDHLRHWVSELTNLISWQNSLDLLSSTMKKNRKINQGLNHYESFTGRSKLLWWTVVVKLCKANKLCAKCGENPVVITAKINLIVHKYQACCLRK